MAWIRSKLFWRIIGFYALLTIPAVVGLLAGVSSMVTRSARAEHEQQAARIVDDVAFEFSRIPYSEAMLAAWQERLEEGQRLSVVDANGRNVDHPEEAPDITIISVASTAARDGQSLRYVRPEGMVDVLAVGRRIDSASSKQVVLLTSELAAARERNTEEVGLIFRSSLFTWVIGMLCLSLVAAGVVAPIQAMSLKLQATVQQEDRDDMLLSVSDRSDEVGDVASALYQLEDQLQDRIAGLELAGREATAAADLLTAVLESMIEGVIAIDRDQRIIYLNESARGLLSIGRSIRAGNRLYEAVRITAFLESVEESLRTVQPGTLEYRSPRKQAHHVLSITPINRPPYSGAVLVIRDITDLRRVEMMRRDFVSGVSHELKTPLTVIQACTDTLLNGALEDPEAAQRFLQRIDEQSERLLQLILSMLQLARVESGEELIQSEDLAAASVVDEVLGSFAPVAQTRSVELKRTGDESLRIWSDRQALRTILNNLVDNALKHTGPGGHIVVDLKRQSDSAEISVRDTGTGIPEELLGRIFERFYRVEKDRSRERGGSGLGLAIVKHLCHSLKATISVTSSPGKGSTFTVTFPIPADSADPRVRRS